MENGTVELARRDTLEKKVMPQEGITSYIKALLDEIQENIYSKALNFRNTSMHRVDTWDELVDVLENKGGFALAHWDGTVESEEKIKQTKATIRCLPTDAEQEDGKCIVSGKPSKQRVVIAKAY